MKKPCGRGKSLVAVEFMISSSTATATAKVWKREAACGGGVHETLRRWHLFWRRKTMAGVEFISVVLER